MNEHKLTHVEMQGRLTPACTCGWYSSRWEHGDFEKHIKKIKELDDDE